jgi:hypothetical protein
MNRTFLVALTTTAGDVATMFGPWPLEPDDADGPESEADAADGRPGHCAVRGPKASGPGTLRFAPGRRLGGWPGT